VLAAHWPFSYLQLYCDATAGEDPDPVVDVMMAVGGRMSDDPLGRREPEVLPTDRPPVGVQDEPAVRHDPRLSRVG
jgi:hypothetical protein